MAKEYRGLAMADQPPDGLEVQLTMGGGKAGQGHAQ